MGIKICESISALLWHRPAWKTRWSVIWLESVKKRRWRPISQLYGHPERSLNVQVTHSCGQCNPTQPIPSTTMVSYSPKEHFIILLICSSRLLPKKLERKSLRPPLRRRRAGRPQWPRYAAHFLSSWAMVLRTVRPIGKKDLRRSRLVFQIWHY